MLQLAPQCVIHSMSCTFNRVLYIQVCGHLLCVILADAKSLWLCTWKLTLVELPL